MFNPSKPITFTRDVLLQVPEGDGVREDTITATFKMLSEEEVDAFDQNDDDGMKEFLRATVTKLGDIVGPDDKPLPYNTELRETMLALPFARLALFLAYNKAVTTAKLGN